MTCSKTDRKRTLAGVNSSDLNSTGRFPQVSFSCTSKTIQCSDKKNWHSRGTLSDEEKKNSTNSVNRNSVKRKLFNEVGGDRGSMSAYSPDRRQLRIPNVPKSDGRTPVTRQFVQLLETALGKELRRPRKRNDPSRRVSRGTSFAELTADDKSDDQGERSSLTLVEAIRTDLSTPSSPSLLSFGVVWSLGLFVIPARRSRHPEVPRHFGDHSGAFLRPTCWKPPFQSSLPPVDTRQARLKRCHSGGCNFRNFDEIRHCFFRGTRGIELYC